MGKKQVCVYTDDGIGRYTTIARLLWRVPRSGRPALCGSLPPAYLPANGKPEALDHTNLNTSTLFPPQRTCIRGDMQKQPLCSSIPHVNAPSSGVWICECVNTFRQHQPKGPCTGLEPSPSPRGLRESPLYCWSGNKDSSGVVGA